MRITENRRIFLNAFATYGRNLLAIALGLLGSRWVLGALGKEDFGLFGVVGSVMAFVTLLSSVMGGAVGRYYAFSIGEARKLCETEGREHVLMWFNAALMVYILMPIMIIIIGYPLGYYAIHHWLVIPAHRISASVWIFNISMFTALISMVTLPYISMYRAYQYIAELSLWDMVRTFLTFGVSFSLLYIGGDKLLYYAVATALISNLIPIIQALRAWRSFGVCNFRREYFYRWDNIRQLCNFSFWEFFGVFGDSVCGNGTSFVINKYFGVTMNAAYSVSRSVANQTTSLFNAMIGALSPAVITAEGSGDRVRMINLAFYTCKFGALSIIVFAIPLIVEMDEVLHLWLVDPPDCTDIYCRCVLFSVICQKLSWGHHMAIYASGKITWYQFTMGMISFSTIFLIWGLVDVGLGAWGVGLSFILSYCLLTFGRVFFAHRIVGMSIMHWLVNVVFPVMVTVLCAFAAGIGVVTVMPVSFSRLCFTTSVCFVVTVLLGYILVCNTAERQYVRGGITRVLNKLKDMGRQTIESL